jgi:hypothetical protein
VHSENLHKGHYSVMRDISFKFINYLQSLFGTLAFLDIFSLIVIDFSSIYSFCGIFLHFESEFN